MQEVLEDLAANKLNFDEYPYVQPPISDSGTGTQPWPYTYNTFNLNRVAPCGSVVDIYTSLTQQH